MKTTTANIQDLRTEAQAAADRAKAAAAKAQAARDAVSQVEAHFDRLTIQVSHSNTILAQAIKDRRVALGAVGTERPKTLAEKLALLKANSTEAKEMTKSLSGEYIELWDALVESLQTDFDRVLTELQLFCRAQDFKEALKYIDKWMSETPVNRESSYYQYDVTDTPMA